MNLSISIVTPSFNQAPFLPECLESVRDQTYRAIEHLVYDPGSPDGSQDVIRQYPHATLFAEPDKGQSDAVSKGFLAARGDIIGWLNSDDYYASNDVFAAVIERFNQPDAPDIVYGRGGYSDDQSQHLRDAYVNESPETLPWRLHKEVGILQPTLFLRRSVVDRLGVLSEDLNFGMDYEYWIRAMKAGLKFAFLPKVLAYGRYYEDNKTLGKRGESLRELCDIVKEQFGYGCVDWLRRYAEFEVEKFDGILAGPHNRTVSDPARIERETKKLLEAYNGSYDTLKFLRDNRGKRPYNQTVKAMEDLGISLDHPFQEIPLDQKSAPYCYCHTVTERRWAFQRSWRDEQLAKTHQAIAKWRSQRQNDTCVIVGNGPSLKEIDFSLLKNQDVFITNYAFLNEELLSYAKYIGVVNYLVAEQGAHQFNLLEGAIKLFPYWLGYCINGGEDTFFFTSMGKPEFSTNIFENVSWRSTVSFFQMQIAYGLGYRRVLMIGFDHNYSQDVSAQEGDILLCEKDDENHFDPRYFKGKRWQAADVNNMEAMYVLAKQAYEADNREIINCTVGGKLELFKRGRLEDYLSQSAMSEASDRRLAKLRNAHRGKRCVIVGNEIPPAIDLSWLQHEVCLGVELNALELSQQHNFSLDYLTVMENDLTSEQLKTVAASSGVKFIGHDYLDRLANQNDLIFIKTARENDFSYEPKFGLSPGDSPGYAAVQLAYYLGFKEVVLLGIPTTKFEVNPDLKRALLEFRSQNRSLIEAKIDSSTSLFPQRDYRELFLTPTAVESKTIYLDELATSRVDRAIAMTIVTQTSAFEGENATIQRNAITSWQAVHPQVEIILLGNAPGTAEIARELSLVHQPQISQMEREMWTEVSKTAKFPLVAYIPADTILTPAFAPSLRQIDDRLDDFLVLGRCWELTVSEPLVFEPSTWERQLQSIVEANTLTPQSDSYFVLPAKLLDSLADADSTAALIELAQQQGYSIVDASDTNIAVKQTYDGALTVPDRVKPPLAAYKLKPVASRYAPAVSVIITASTSAKINRAIESILCQTATNYEIIIVGDRNQGINKAVQPYIGCIKYINSPQSGVLAARNAGIWASSGELIMFLDANDYLPPSSLQQQLDCFDAEAIDLLLSGSQIENDRNIEPWLELPNLTENLHIWQLWKLWRPLNNSNIMYRRDRLWSSNGFKINLHPEVATVELLLGLTSLTGCRAKWLQRSTSVIESQPDYGNGDLLKLAQDFETVLNDFFADPRLKPWMQELKPIARYNASIWLGWLINNGDRDLRQNEYLRRSLSYTSSDHSEITAHWLTRFDRFSDSFGRELPPADLETLQNLLA
ncbi:MAG: glycosyltransferase [Cyanobacteria bacterium J06631_2]